MSPSLASPSRLIVSHDLPSLMRLPDFEFCFLGLLLVAVTFYAGLALGGDSDSNRRGNVLSAHELATIALVLLTTPYALFLWWLTLSRCAFPPSPPSPTDVSTALEEEAFGSSQNDKEGGEPTAPPPRCDDDKEWTIAAGGGGSPPSPQQRHSSSQTGVSASKAEWPKLSRLEEEGSEGGEENGSSFDCAISAAGGSTAGMGREAGAKADPYSSGGGWALLSWAGGSRGGGVDEVMAWRPSQRTSMYLLTPEEASAASASCSGGSAASCKGGPILSSGADVVATPAPKLLGKPAAVPAFRAQRPPVLPEALLFPNQVWSAALTDVGNDLLKGHCLLGLPSDPKLASISATRHHSPFPIKLTT